MTDHRTIPGITWASAPGPLRAGDYWRHVNGRVFRFDSIVASAIGAGEIGFRVIPVVRPLDVPEPSTETRADMEACAEVVVAVAYDGDVRMAAADDLGSEDNGCGSARHCAQWDEDRADSWDMHPMPDTEAKRVPMYDNTEADAVLWVVEGKLP